MNLLFFSALTMFINCGSVKWATRIQDTFTFGKLIALVILIVIGLIEVGSGKQNKCKFDTWIIIILLLLLWKGWTQESIQKVEFDRPGERSPE